MIDRISALNDSHGLWDVLEELVQEDIIYISSTVQRTLKPCAWWEQSISLYGRFLLLPFFKIERSLLTIFYYTITFYNDFKIR